MDFYEACQYLLSLGHETLAIKLGLRNTHLLLDALGNPQQSYSAVQIAGTNGKGSTAAFLDSILRRAGIKTGLFTSPHLESITERVKVDGIDISFEEFARQTTTVREAANRLFREGHVHALPTFFEHVTAIALAAFRQAGVELAILETGLGGRLDSTTAVEARICGITDIGFDHEEYLGNTIESIAAEKAAIIHSGSTALIAHQLPEAMEVILKRCTEVGVTPLVDGCRTTIEQVSADGRCQVTFETAADAYEKVWTGLRGRHQVQNAALAVQLAEVVRTPGFDIPREAIIEGVENASHPGRLELIAGQPMWLLDGAHNSSGGSALRDYLVEFGCRPLTMVFGAMRDKRIEHVAESIFPLADELVLTEIDNPRTASIERLVAIAKDLGRPNISTGTTSGEALRLAVGKTPRNGMICITGSLYLIGETRGQIRQSSAANLKTT